jgi:Tfp pilus assembly protein PilF
MTDILAWVEYLKGSQGQTLPMFKECVRKDPERAVYRYHLGMALLATGDKQQAKSELEAALRLKLSSDDARQARDTLARIQAN